MSQLIIDLPEIPEEFSEYAEEIKATMKDSIQLKLKTADDLKPWDSKIGGLPYFPKDVEYPKRKENGKPLMMLAQINFEDMPKLEGYPEKGILQLYIDSTVDILGMDFENVTSQNGFRAIYFENVIKDESALISTNPCEDLEYSPVHSDKPYAIEFTPQRQYITENDYRIDNLQLSKVEDGDLLDNYGEWASEKLHGHRIGGYPYFTQEDPRVNKKWEGYELLFQLDTEFSEENGINIMWGDAGVGAFFIKPEDLKAKNFDNVLYNWDCY